MRRAIIAATLFFMILIKLTCVASAETGYIDCSMRLNGYNFYTVYKGDPIISAYVNGIFTTMYPAPETGDYFVYSELVSYHFRLDCWGVDYTEVCESVPSEIKANEFDFEGYHFVKVGTLPVVLIDEISPCWLQYYEVLSHVFIVGESSTCGASIPTIPTLIRQCDSRWGNVIYDHPDEYEWASSFYLPGIPSDICQKGCGLSSVNMLMNSKGCYPSFLETNDCVDCFMGKGIYWPNVFSSYCPSVKYLDSKEFTKFKKIKDTNVDFSKDITDGYSYILHVKDKHNKCGHFVYMTGVSEDCKSLSVLDPSNRVKSVSEICGYRKFK